MIGTQTEATVELRLRRYCAAALLDVAGFENPAQVDAVVDYRLEHLAYQIAAVLKIMSYELQRERVVAEYPASLWQHIRKAVGLSYRSTRVLLDEFLLYPKIKAPLPGGVYRVEVRQES